MTASDAPAGDPGPEAGPPPGIDGRTWHFRDFYGVGPQPDDDAAPLLVVHGNCQAEALRVVLAGSTDRFRTVRVPAVHELTAADVEPLQRLLARCDVLLSQPVSTGYHDLPLGTADVRSAAPRARLVMFPVVRDSRLHPFQALVRVPAAGEPPVVPYHDLRTLALAASIDGSRTAAAPAGRPAVQADGVREVARRSQAELARRQREHGTIAVDDLLEAAGAEASHTLNHPGNPVLLGLARRVLDELDDDHEAIDPGRTLLRSVLSPLDADVLDALGLDPGRARADWSVDGVPVPDETVVGEQLSWYGRHPDVVRAGLRRHGATMEVLGL
ncbi:WcbI family polysaccharide biosynthesis putative acetyltransferase [Jannaschia sp. R86511]|uniref:WcbI family polysaccharide biosynthesis putative acetyltransferase n=1 Tax=Jannaschia sp. R86511 TaxID=3093853 RepID=UPI0036D2CC93